MWWGGDSGCCCGGGGVSGGCGCERGGRVLVVVKVVMTAFLRV